MSTVTTAGPDVPALAGLHRRRRTTWARFRTNRAGFVALLGVGVLVVVAIAAPLLAPYDPAAQDTANILAGPFSRDHVLGTDGLGRDVLSRLIFATRIAMTAPLLVLVVALSLGVAPGLLAGYVGGRLDGLVMRITDSLQSFPPTLLAIALLAALGPGLTNAMVAVGVVFAPSIIRIVRSSVFQIREEQYIEAARAIGTRWPTIVARHVLPNVVGPLLVQSALLTGFALLAEAALSFLGLGVAPPGASWGTMLSTGFGFLYQQPWLWVWPAVLLVLTVLAWNLVGDALRDSIGREDHPSAG